MGLFSSIFGSSPGQVGGGEIIPTSTLTDEQKRLMNQTLIPFLESRPLATLRDAPAPLASTGQTPLGGASLAALEQIAMGIGEEGGAAGVTDTNRAALKDITTRGPQDIDEFFTQVIQDPLLKSFNRDILPQIGRQFGGNSFFSSERREADSRAREDLLDSLARSRTQVGFEGRQQDTENTLAAIGASAGVESLVPQLITQLLGAGEIVRGQETELLGAERDEELRQRAEKDKVISQILSALGIQAQENIVFGQKFSEGQEGLGVGDIATIASLGAGAAAGIGPFAFLCDSRFKTDITLIGTLRGIRMYIFKYLNNSGWYIGPMAQDLEVTHPDIVTDIGGVKLVSIKPIRLGV